MRIRVYSVLLIYVNSPFTNIIVCPYNKKLSLVMCRKHDSVCVYNDFEIHGVAFRWYLQILVIAIIYEQTGKKNYFRRELVSKCLSDTYIIICKSVERRTDNIPLSFLIRHIIIGYLSGCVNVRPYYSESQSFSVMHISLWLCLYPKTFRLCNNLIEAQ